MSDSTLRDEAREAIHNGAESSEKSFAVFEEHASVLLAAIVDSSDDAIVSKTLDGVITSWNSGAERMFGWPAQMAIGKHITLIAPEDRRAEEDDVLARVRRGERIDHFETVRMARNGRLIDISLTVSPVRNRFGHIVGASKVARDISERRRLDEYRNVLLKHEHEARTAAEALIRAKDQFLATISHELRTPLNAIFGWARLLERPELDEQSRKRAITAIVKGASAQARLVEDLLDLSRAVTGRLRLDVGPLSLRDVVEAALDTIRPAANAKQIELVTTLAEVGLMQGAARVPGVLAGRQLHDASTPRHGPWSYLSEASRRIAWRLCAGRKHRQREWRDVYRDAAVDSLGDLQRPAAAAITRHRRSGSTGLDKCS